jgi:hypothetical protein
MKQFDPNNGASRTEGEHKRETRGASIGLLATVALLAAAFAVGLFVYSTAGKQTASTDNAAPSLTTGAATSKPNNTGVTPPASR